MRISDNTIDLYMDINDFSDNQMKNRQVILNLLELSTHEENKKTFSELIFAGKYIDGMMTIINDKNPDEKTKEYLNAELSKNFEKVISLLKQISGDDENTGSKDLIQIELPNADSSNEVTFSRPEENEANKEIKSLLRSKYYELTPQSLLNLISLSSDLGYIKKYFNINPQ